MNTIVVRTMESCDVEAIIAMARNDSGFSNPESGKEGFWEYGVLKNWVEHQGDDVLLVAEYDGQLAGFVLTMFHKPTGKASWENQFVLDTYRGKGIASALWDEMESRLKKAGATFIAFLVKSDNPYIHFYQTKCGDGVKCQWLLKEL